MAEYIEKQALLKALEADFSTDWADYASKNNFDKDYIDGVRDEYDDVLTIIRKQPAADVQPVKRGRWIAENRDIRGYADCYTCSNCQNYTYTYTLMRDCEYDYCPNCGAYMRGDENGTKT